MSRLLARFFRDTASLFPRELFVVAPAMYCHVATILKQIGPIVDKQPVRRQLDGYSCMRKRSIRTGPDLIFIGQCEATLVWGPETGADCNFEIPDQITGL